MTVDAIRTRAETPGIVRCLQASLDVLYQSSGFLGNSDSPFLTEFREGRFMAKGKGNRVVQAAQAARKTGYLPGRGRKSQVKAAWRKLIRP